MLLSNRILSHEKQMILFGEWWDYRWLLFYSPYVYISVFKKNQKIKDLKNDYNIFHKIEKFSLLILNGKTRLQKL